MIKRLFSFIIISSISLQAFPKEFEKYEEWKNKPNEHFSDAESTFKLVQQKLLGKYIDKNLTKDDLYRAATSGMLAALNNGDTSWNKLLSPGELAELEADLTGQVTGIGVEMKFDESSGYAYILKVIPRSPAEKAGVQKDDQILSVDGKKFKGKQFRDIIHAIRGKVGDSVGFKILREDKIVSMNIKREIIPWKPVELQKINESTALLTIGYFNAETPKLVEQGVEEVNSKKYSKLIVDLRGNAGGGFDQAIKVSELFFPRGTMLATSKDRSGSVEKFQSTKGLLNNSVQVIVLADKETSCGAELFASALRENLGAKIIGETTLGKWNAQILEKLPNKFAVKYTVKTFQSPKGNSFQDRGLAPDVEVLLPKDVDAREIGTKYEMPKRLELDPQLKAATEIIKAS